MCTVSTAAIVCVGIVCVQCQPQKLDRKCSSVCNISKILSLQNNPHLRYMSTSFTEYHVKMETPYKEHSTSEFLHIVNK